MTCSECGVSVEKFTSWRIRGSGFSDILILFVEFSLISSRGYIAAVFEDLLLIYSSSILSEEL